MTTSAGGRRRSPSVGSRPRCFTVTFFVPLLEDVEVAPPATVTLAEPAAFHVPPTRRVMPCLG